MGFDTKEQARHMFKELVDNVVGKDDSLLKDSFFELYDNIKTDEQLEHVMDVLNAVPVDKDSVSYYEYNSYLSGLVEVMDADGVEFNSAFHRETLDDFVRDCNTDRVYNLSEIKPGSSFKDIPTKEEFVDKLFGEGVLRDARIKLYGNSFEDFLKAGSYVDEPYAEALVENEANPHTFPDALAVHNGVFHADDVLCAAMFKAVKGDDAPVFRIPSFIAADKTKIPVNMLVADVGNGKYDHHQKEGVPVREDGNKRAACGLVLDFIDKYADEAYNDSQMDVLSDGRLNSMYPDVDFDREGDDILMDEAIDNMSDMDKAAYNLAANMVSIAKDEFHKIEDHDNGIKNGEPSIVSLYVNFCNPEWDEAISPDEAFDKAVVDVKKYFVEPIINGKEPDMDFFKDMYEDLKIKHDVAVERADKGVREALAKSDGNIVVMDKYMPWKDVLCESSAKFVIHPSNRGGYALTCVPPEPDSFEQKIPLPESWIENKPKGCDFVHNGRFIASFDTEENAVKGAQMVMAMQRVAGIDVDMGDNEVDKTIAD